jgi:hypothetical protein
VLLPAAACRGQSGNLVLTVGKLVRVQAVIGIELLRGRNYMKLYLLASLCALVSYSLALAAESTLDSATLGQMDAIVAHCSKIKPEDSARYQQLLKPVIADASAEDLAAARKTQAYQRAYESIAGDLAAAPKEDAVAVCVGAIAEK